MLQSFSLCILLVLFVSLQASAEITSSIHDVGYGKQVERICADNKWMLGCHHYQSCIKNPYNLECRNSSILLSLCRDRAQKYPICRQIEQKCETDPTAEECNMGYLNILPRLEYLELRAEVTCRIGSDVLSCDNLTNPWEIYSSFCNNIENIKYCKSLIDCQDLCGTYNSICERFNWSTCNAKVKVVQSLQDPCISNPSLKTCLNYTLPASIYNLEGWCKDNRDAAGCSILDYCKAKKLDGDYCKNITVLTMICELESDSAPECKYYRKMCASGSIVSACKYDASILKLPTKRIMNDYLDHVYTNMISYKDLMKSNSESFDLLLKYSETCMENPEIIQCVQWKDYCRHTPLSNLDFCRQPVKSLPVSYNSENIACVSHKVREVTQNNGTHAGQKHDMSHSGMEMYFHFGYEEYMLLKEWKPTSLIWYIFACICCSLATILLDLLRFLRARFEKHSRACAESTEYKPYCSSFSYSYHWSWKTEIPRSIFQTIEVALSLLIMLLAMTFNIGIFLSIAAGTLIGSLLVGRFVFHENKTCH